MEKHLNIKIHGQVQGVFFRVSAKEEAEKLGISGFVRNERDGTVYIEVEGEEENLNKFVKWCHNGPEHAQVDKVEVIEDPLKNFSDFNRDFVDY
ncbi:MAG: acylphosphatase [Patescibacteria group bacterium]